MMRRTIVVGDAPACGGRVLPYTAELASTIHGHPVALIGGRVYCEGCHSVGIIAKAGGPRREGFISEVALEGDVVVCHCPKPPPLISTLQTTSYNDDGAGTHRAADVAGLAALSVVSGAQDIAAAKRLVDAEVVHPPEAEQTDRKDLSEYDEQGVLHFDPRLEGQSGDADLPEATARAGAVESRRSGAR